MILLLIKTFMLMLFVFKYCELCSVLCIYWFNRLGRPPETFASANWRWDLHWKCVLSPGATGPPSLFHGYLDTHSPEWRHATLNPGICDAATDRRSIGADSIKHQIKAGTSKGPARRQHGDVTGETGAKMSEGRKRKKKKLLYAIPERDRA